MCSHTQACMYSLDRDYDPVSMSMCYSICFSPSTEQHLQGQRKPLDNTTDKNRCCCYYETDHLFVRIHRMCICLHQCSVFVQTWTDIWQLHASLSSSRIYRAGFICATIKRNCTNNYKQVPTICCWLDKNIPTAK